MKNLMDTGSFVLNTMKVDTQFMLSATTLTYIVV